MTHHGGNTPDRCPVCGRPVDHIPSHIRRAFVVEANGEYRCPPTVRDRQRMGLTDVGHEGHAELHLP